MTQPDTGQRRREDDFKAHPENSESLDPVVDRRRTTRRPRRAPGRAFLRRFRQPIIGLSLAGAAAPMINAGTNPADQPGAKPTEADQARLAGATAPTGDLEDRIADQIGKEHHAAKQSSF